jgi:hypothetical protein
MDDPQKIQEYKQAVIDTAKALSIRIGYAETGNT